MLYTEPNHSSNVAKGDTPNKPTEKPAENKQEPVIKGKVHMPKKSFTDQLIDTFVLGNRQDIKDYLINTVAIPTIKKAAINAFAMALNVTPPPDTGYRSAGGYSDPKITDYRSNTPYNNYSRPSRPVESAYSGTDSRRRIYSDMWFESASDAEAVLEHLRKTLNRYRFVSVGDVYMACDERTTTSDFDWGWYDVKDMYVYRRGTNQFSIHFPPVSSR